MSSPGFNRARRRSARKRAARGLKPKLRPGTKRRLDVNPPFVVRKDVYLRVRDAVRQSGVVPYLNRRLHSHRGRKCAYDAETLLVGILMTVVLDLDMEHTSITKALGALAPQDGHQLGVVSTDGRMVSYRSVNHQIDRLAHALRDSWVDSDGTECDLDWLITKLLHAAVPKRYRDVTALAIDATAVEAWGGFLRGTNTLNSDPDVAEAAREADEAYADVEGPANLDAAVREATGDEASASPARACKPLDDDLELPIGPDGRTIYTTDVDARAGYRTATNKQKGTTFVGYHLHLAVATRDFTWQGDPTQGALGEYVPPFILGTQARPANEHSGDAAVQMLNRIVPDLPSLKEVIVDRGYTTAKPEKFVWPTRALGLDVVMDLTEAQRKRVRTIEVEKRRRTGGAAVKESVIVTDGGVFHEWMPEEQHVLSALPREVAPRKEIQKTYDQRAQLWRWSVTDRDRNTGDVTFRCPFCAGRVHNRAIKAKRRRPSTSTHVAVPRGATTCCQGKVTIDPEVLGELWQAVPYGTGAWSQSYGRRALVETANALIKSSFARLERGYFKVMGLHKVSLLIGLLCVGVNLQMAHRLEEFGVPRQLTDEEKKARRTGRGGRKRIERTLAELAMRYPEHGKAPPGEAQGLMQS